MRPEEVWKWSTQMIRGRTVSGEVWNVSAFFSSVYVSYLLRRSSTYPGQSRDRSRVEIENERENGWHGSKV